jgi:2-polyprenyl-6-methoxyphenol hydroxylase-like FAD-dependent oxidoreductase
MCRSHTDRPPNSSGGVASRRPKRAIIAGAGPGGLTAACALRRAGFEIIVFERASRLEPAGSGLTLWPNASRALERLDLLPALLAITRPFSKIAMRNWHNRVLFADELPNLDGRDRFCSAGVLRHDLIKLLSAPIADAITTNARVVGLRQGSEMVSVHLADGREFWADVLVAADGLHSAVRSRLVSDDPLLYAGYTVWRGIAPVVLGQLVGTTWMGPGKQFGLFPLGAEHTYWFACLKAKADGGDTPDGSRARVMESFADAPEPVLQVVRASDDSSILRTDVYDRAPLRQWSFGRVALLGDAAHPASPTLGQGACQAIEDGVVLGACLAGADVVSGLRKYEAIRMKRANRFVREARRIGKIGLWHSQMACASRDFLISAVPSTVRRRRFARMFAFSM